MTGTREAPDEGARRAGPSGLVVRAVQRQRGHLLHWAPVAFGIGIAIWFALPSDPAPVALVAASLACVTLGLVAGRAGPGAPLILALAFILAGGIAADLRARSVGAPVLGFRYYGPVEGRIVGIDRSASDAVRLTLDEVHLGDLPPAPTPERVRVSLYGPQDYFVPEPGRAIMLTANLSPPNGPAEPGGFDFRRHAWFDRLGAVGYTRTPVLTMDDSRDTGPSAWIFRLRMSISAGVRAQMDGPAGAFAAAILTGDRSGLDLERLEHLRASNLAHLLAISGLHMGLLTGVVLGAIRLGLALVPYAALRWPCRKIAASGALVAAAGYLALSGGSVSTERAFVMVSVMLGAVLLERRAISLRAVAIAALIVLARRPEELLSPGFQMSFAATTALVAIFGSLRGLQDIGPRMPRIATPILATFLSSAIAGAATAPYAAAHFGRLSDYGLIANLLSVPVMGLLVMPAAVLTACLWPLGLSGIGLGVMKLGLVWILRVAETVSSWPGAVTAVHAPGLAVLPLLTLGALWLILWQGLARLAGLPVLAAALALWWGTERPPVLIAASGGLVGIMGEEGRALSKPVGDGFVASIWLENDGDTALQDAAARRPGFTGRPGEFRADLPGGQTLAVVTGRGNAARAGAACDTAHIVVTTATDPPRDGPCLMLDSETLGRTGTLALWPDGQGGWLPVSALGGARRAWSGRAAAD
ncbi:ComEC/Rec2 family competence protein [Tropicimonas sp. IMCC34011]|uniref:ComEC/Rec2 family competence protein n=1 Tax=Tropicimonas sp. IMCC34011 TaxID=2248759 RepID=UPI000E2281AF|nr:ComEC/Rec2 family competence protein [Tropicimonas sp. IMCC34011]